MAISSTTSNIETIDPEEMEFEVVLDPIMDKGLDGNGDIAYKKMMNLALSMLSRPGVWHD